MLKQGIEVKLGQSLSMTPQLQQAIRLLQLSSMDLQQEIKEMVETNPLLEYTQDRESTLTSAESLPEKSSDLPEKPSLDETIPNEMSVDADWQDVYQDVPSRSQGSLDGEGVNLIETMNAAEEGLSEHLLWQIHLSHLSATDKLIAETLIDYINDQGYLDENVSTIHQLFDEELMIDLDEVEAVLHYIQALDPVGVGARSLGECLSLQIQKQYKQHPLADKALVLLDKHLDILQKRDVIGIKRKLKINDEDYLSMVSLLRQLKAHPGDVFQCEDTDYVTPDVYVVKDNEGEWQVSLNGEIAPSVQVNQEYADLADQCANKKDSQYIKQNLEQARWFLKALDNRGHTIERVARVIVEKQKAFLHYGEVAMKPMILKDIAELLDLHESTISRVTSNKYIHTPKGVYELKHFFSSHVSTEAGGECASTAIRAMIQRFVQEENTKKPLSDSKLTQLLKEQGINVARRTVAKYRESLSIPSSRERKSLA